MRALSIIAPILLLLLLCLLARVRIVLVYKKEARAYIRYLFLRFPLYPPKKKRVRISDFSYENLKKRKKKTAASNASRKPQSPTQKKPKNPISAFYRVLKVLYPRLLRHFRIDATRIHITVGTGDAAKTAIAYGVVSQSVAYICAILDQHTNFRAGHKSAIAVIPDFTAETFSADCKISASLQLWQVIRLGIYFFAKLIENKKASATTQDI